MTVSILLARKTARRQAAAFHLEGILDYFNREITQSRVQSGESRGTEGMRKREGGWGGERERSRHRRRKRIGSERAMICES